MNQPAGWMKALYGVFFVAALPLLLWAWARATRNDISVTLVPAPLLGGALAGAGLLIVILGMAALWIHGRGLPMNLAPPGQYVTQGIYRIVPHPIYTGFCAACVGISLATGSASGLLLVSPLAALGCAALVLGYESPDLRARFDAEVRRLNAVLPANEEREPALRETIRCYLLVLVPWFFLYEAVILLGVPHDAISAYLPFEHRLPVWEWTELIYASCYVLTALAPLFARSARELRRFSVQSLLAMGVAFPLFLLLPLVVVPRPFTPHTILGTLLASERALDTPGAAFPSFHVIWAVLAAEVFARRAPRTRWLWRGWALLVAASCITTGMHALVDVAGAFLVVALVRRAGNIWEWLRKRAERIANSWRDWRFGPVRVISHGAYAGVAGAVGVLIPVMLAGRESTAAVLLAVSAGVICAALWAQFIEGSPALLRPFGYFGGLLGTALGALGAPWTGASAWLVLAALGMAAPWVQAIGRLRCLVQGCCHGSPAPEGTGIRCAHAMSRVCRLTSWTNVPIHPTQLYSILWNVVVGVVLARLWMLHAHLHMIVGLYLILTGLGRFVEEAYRGEPQTPIYARLRVYQWIVIATTAAGALVTSLGNAPNAPAARWESIPFLPAIGFGLFCWFAYGVDFPNANRRFARLA